MGSAITSNNLTPKEIRSIDQESSQYFKTQENDKKRESSDLNIFLTILSQMKTCICKIEIEKENYFGTGFFCTIPDSKTSGEKPVLITSYKIIGKKNLISENSIKLIFFKKPHRLIKINKHRKIFTSNELKDNITIIEIKKEDNINIDINDMLKIDNGIYNENYLKYIYKNKSIYSIYFCRNEVRYDISTITNIDSDTNKFIHLCPIGEGTLGAPILNLENYKVIGVNIGNNLGTILKGSINEFIRLKKNKSKFFLNEIILNIEINRDDVNKSIYFLDNTDYRDYETNKYHFHDYLKEINQDNTKLLINEKEYPFQKFFRPRKEGIYFIKLIFSIQLTDCSHMFYSCYNIINIDLSFFDSSKVTNMSYMFSLCLNLVHLDLSYLDTRNVTDMNNMFYFCKNLKNLDVSKLNTEKVINMSRMFSDCSELKYLELTNFNTKNVKSMSHMFFLCKNLTELDFSTFDTSNVIIMSNMFYFCRYLIKLDLTSFNTEKVFDMSKMFYLCRNLNHIYLSSFNTKNVINMSYMFADCKNLLTLDLSSFDTRKVINMEHFLSGCDLTNIDLSNFNTINVSNMGYMFYFCKNLKYINVSSFNTKNVKSMTYMFSDCRFLRHIDLSSFNLQNVIDMSKMFAGCIKNLKIRVNKDSIERFRNENEKCNFYI